MSIDSLALLLFSRVLLGLILLWQIPVGTEETFSIVRNVKLGCLSQPSSLRMRCTIPIILSWHCHYEPAKDHPVRQLIQLSAFFSCYHPRPFSSLRVINHWPRIMHEEPVTRPHVHFTCGHCPCFNPGCMGDRWLQLKQERTHWLLCYYMLAVCELPPTDRSTSGLLC